MKPEKYPEPLIDDIKTGGKRNKDEIGGKATKVVQIIVSNETKYLRVYTDVLLN